MNARHRYPAMKAATCAMPGIPYRPAAYRDLPNWLCPPCLARNRASLLSMNMTTPPWKRQCGDRKSWQRWPRKTGVYALPSGPDLWGRSAGLYPGYSGYHRRTTADYVAKSLQIAKDSGLTAAGYLEHGAGLSAMMNSHGLFAYHTQTGVDFSITMRTADGTGSAIAAKGTTIFPSWMYRPHRQLPPGRLLTPAAPARWSRANIPSSSNRQQASSCWKISTDHWTPAARMKVVVSSAYPAVRPGSAKSWWTNR